MSILESNKKDRMWEPVTGSSPVKQCMFCNNYTSMKFYTLRQLNESYVTIRSWFFCSDVCVEKYKGEVRDI